ncbi:MAG: carboxypeptidase-like regulatory domain-containing protein, partial [Bacteroidota bacterium]
MKITHLKLVLSIVCLCFLFSSNLHAQTIKGSIINSDTKEALAFVHVGVAGKNVGSISDDTGSYEIDISSIGKTEQILFSRIGFETAEYTLDELKGIGYTVSLLQVKYELPLVEVNAKKIEEIKLGRVKPSKTTTGQSGIKEWGLGGEWGLKIKHTGENYFLKNIHFHTRFNTMDSVLFRMNVYEVNNDLPGSSLLRKEVFTTSYAKDKWITADLLEQNLLIEKDIIITFELIRIWYSKKGENQLFFTLA